MKKRIDRAHDQICHRQKHARDSQLSESDKPLASMLDRTPTAGYYVCRKDANQITDYIVAARYTTCVPCVTVFAKEPQTQRQTTIED